MNLYFEHFQDLVELNKTKNILRNIFLSKSTNYDLELLYKIVKEMDNETKSWNGEFTFVYIPTWERYFHKHTNLNAVITLKDEIIDEPKTLLIRLFLSNLVTDESLRHKVD